MRYYLVPVDGSKKKEINLPPEICIKAIKRTKKPKRIASKPLINGHNRNKRKTKSK